MNGAMRQTMWGFIFAVVDIRIMNVDIIPDWIGYLLIAFGCAKAATYTTIRYFRYAQLTVLVLLLAHIGAVIAGGISGQSTYIDLNHPPGYSASFYMMTIIPMLHLLLVYWICIAIHEYAGMHGLRELQSKAANRWKGYLLCSTLILAAISFIPNADHSFINIIFPAAVITFILELFIIHLLLGTARVAHKLEPSS